ncbi:MAG: hypothetical protein C0621_04475 [Desulfuromonas sp.]|nr:MAG: hypothetical protein C0621_04475 [Desulfuromonas sp.]
MFPGAVLDNLQRPFSFQKSPPLALDSSLLQEALSLAQLPQRLLEREAATLSIGQQQRVGLARALSRCSSS